MDNDVDMLIPELREDEETVLGLKESEEEISRVFLRIGIAQLVLGLLLIGGGIATSTSDYDIGEGIWGGAFVLICGSLAITARYHLQAEVVIASLILNLLTCLLLAGGIIFAAYATFDHFNFHYIDAVFAGFMALNCGLVSCLVLSIYLAIVFAKILNEKRKYRNNCCFRGSSSMNYGGYKMVYVPPGMQQASSGAFMAVPAEQASQVNQI